TPPRIHPGQRPQGREPRRLSVTPADAAAGHSATAGASPLLPNSGTERAAARACHQVAGGPALTRGQFSSEERELRDRRAHSSRLGAEPIDRGRALTHSRPGGRTRGRVEMAEARQPDETRAVEIAGGYEVVTYSFGAGDEVVLCLNGGPGLPCDYLR